MFWKILNSYSFSIAMVVLYLHPFLTTPTPKATSLKKKKNATAPPGTLSWWSAAVENATWNWMLWLSVMTQLVFQLPHNWFTDYLELYKGTVVEWPFVTYGISDARWNFYTPLAPEVWLINYNDGLLGVLVGVALLNARPWGSIGRSGHFPQTCLLVLAVVFRDATLWRETVEYMWDHHRHGYPHTIADPDYRTHGIVLLWLVNIIWLIAPLSTPIWAYNVMMHSKTNKKD